MDLEKFFNNQSVGAFLGAFAAFVLVVANDWRRERRKLKTLRAEFDVCLGHCTSKLETVRQALLLAREHNGVSPAPVMPFNTAIIRQLTAEAVDRLTIDQRRAIDGLCYRMEATDGVLHQIYQAALLLSGALGQAQRVEAARRLLIDMQDAIVNLRILNLMLSNYLSGKFAEVVSSKYDRAQFEEV